jgi:hypothetical protein
VSCVCEDGAKVIEILIQPTGNVQDEDVVRSSTPRSMRESAKPFIFRQ